MSTPYRLQPRNGRGIVIKQGQSWLMLSPNEIRQLITDLQNHLDGPQRVEENDGLQKANHR